MPLLLTLAFGVTTAWSSDIPLIVDPGTLTGPLYCIDAEHGWAIAEAEHLSSKVSGREWRLSRSRSQLGSYSGHGYLISTAQRGDPGKAVDQLSEAADLGRISDWLVLRFYVRSGQEGTYRLTWLSNQIDGPGPHECLPVALGKDIAELNAVTCKPQPQFTWDIHGGDSGRILKVDKPGIYAFALISRSIGHAVDRLAVYREKPPIDPTIPESEVIAEGQYQDLRAQLLPFAMPGFSSVLDHIQAGRLGAAMQELQETSSSDPVVAMRSIMEDYATSWITRWDRVRKEHPVETMAAMNVFSVAWSGNELELVIKAKIQEWRKDTTLEPKSGR